MPEGSPGTRDGGRRQTHSRRNATYWRQRQCFPWVTEEHPSNIEENYILVRHDQLPSDQRRSEGAINVTSCTRPCRRRSESPRHPEQLWGCLIAVRTVARPWRAGG